ncbi:MAG: Unknown protein [uncultured Sulfurovum sp.]|uniref:Sulfatase-modifying factor enzyme-like domain-containing protein n=1 Tax=uncultured Sulfurovum sp. TaxID=269237 RepID=A0A6S6TI23_9BACT|nr:MAG: Unknown protein [uncultured Sulfurovum sp.]
MKSHLDAIALLELDFVYGLLQPKKIPTPSQESDIVAFASAPLSTATSQESYNYVSHKIVIEKAQKAIGSFEDEGSTKRVSIPLKENRPQEMPDILRQFESYRVKLEREHENHLNESKTADIYTMTDLLTPYFLDTQEYGARFHIHLLEDSNSSMFLWAEHVAHFLKSIQRSKAIVSFSYYQIDTTEGTSQVYLGHTKQKVKRPLYASSPQNTLTFVLSDHIGLAWQNPTIYKSLKAWSEHSFVAMVSMLPEYMWSRSSLRKGFSMYTHSALHMGTNDSLKPEYDFFDTQNLKEHLTIPVLAYDDSSFAHLGRLLTKEKKQWIHTYIFTTSDETQHKKTKESKDREPKERVESYLATATSNARRLAIYASVLPLHYDVLRQLISKKELGDTLDAFAEFYFGGLLDKEKSEGKVYDFYAGVRRELLHYIGMDEAKEIFVLLDGAIRQALDINYSLIDLLYLNPKSTYLGDEKDHKLAEMLLEILSEIGLFYTTAKENLAVSKDTIHLNTNSFQMGSEDGRDNEKPVHTVTFEHDFAIAKYPVTFAEYDLYCEDTGAKKPDDEGWGRVDRPVINVSWDDAQKYCKWLSQKSGQDYRLPSEAEWEYACRADTTTKWSFGDDVEKLKDYAWYTKNSESKTQEVGKKKENPWGLYDMHGNVWEWCQDSWVDNYINTPRDGTVHEDESTSSKVLRGGSWLSYGNGSRSAYRFSRYVDSLRINIVGFRLLRTLP